MNCIHCHSDLKKYVEVFHGSCSVLCSFTDVAAGDGYPASWLGSRADPQAGRMGTSWLFTSLRAASSKSECQPGASAGVRIQTCTCVP